MWLILACLLCKHASQTTASLKASARWLASLFGLGTEEFGGTTILWGGGKKQTLIDWKQMCSARLTRVLSELLQARYVDQIRRQAGV